MDVWYHRPDGALADAPILIVVPGRGRNADEYRDEWLAIARSDSVVLLVPEFPSDLYPTRQYNLGNLVDSEGEVVPREEWTFSVIEALFDEVRQELSGNQDGYYLYGHSAGAQFVHRFMLFMDHPNVVMAVSANAGWYTVPDANVAFPYGLDNGPVPVDDDTIGEMTSAPLTILLGGEDTDPEASGLRRDEEALEQGATRLDRGFHFFQQGQRAAADHDARFAWAIEVVDGVGHSNEEMAAAAATVFFG